MRPRLESIVDSLRSEHYPFLQGMDKSGRLNAAGEPYYCGYPAAYVLTQTIKAYRSMLVTKTGTQKPETKELALDRQTVIPARYVCVQCRESYPTIEDFHTHIQQAQNRRLQAAQQQSIVQ